MDKLPISVILITLNEEENLDGALANLTPWAEAVYVVDSLSTDGTVDVALRHGAHVVQHPFENFGAQWNWAVERLPIRTPWTFKVDPDERIPDALVEELRGICRDDPPFEGYEARVRLWFMGQPLHVHNRYTRLWRTGRCRFSETSVNEHPLIDGRLGVLRHPIEHLDSPDLHRWFEKQNRYSTMEAINRFRGGRLAAEPRLLGTRLERRMWLKRAFLRMPFRYGLLWLYEYFSRGAVLDGRLGAMWARLRVEHRRNAELKHREMVLRDRVVDLPPSPTGDYDPRVAASALQQEIFPVPGDDRTHSAASRSVGRSADADAKLTAAGERR